MSIEYYDDDFMTLIEGDKKKIRMRRDKMRTGFGLMSKVE